MLATEFGVMSRSEMELNPVFEACYINDDKKIQVFLESRVCPNSIHDVGRYSLLQAACEGVALNAVDVLLKNGADPNFMISKISRIDGRKDLDNGYALMCVYKIEIAELLRKNGANVDYVEAHGDSALDWERERNLDEFC